MSDEQHDEQLTTLLAALQSPEHATRWQAAEALGNLGDRRAVEPLIALVKHFLIDKRLQQAAITALGKLGDPRAVEPLAWRLIYINIDKNIVLALIEALAALNDQHYIFHFNRIPEVPAISFTF